MLLDKLNYTRKYANFKMFVGEMFRNQSKYSLVLKTRTRIYENVRLPLSSRLKFEEKIST